MGFDKIKIRQICWIILYVALIMFALLHIETVVSGVGFVIGMLKPFLVGGMIAFILNIPMKGIETKLLGKWQGKAARILKRPVSLILSILFLVAVIVLVVLAVLPQLQETIRTLGEKLPGFLEDVIEALEKIAVNYPALEEHISKLAAMEFDWNSIISSVADFLKDGVTNMLSSTVNVASGIIGGVTTSVIAFIFSLYILTQKEKLQGQIKRIISAYLPEKVDSAIREVSHRLYVNFSNFICGQCIEAVILGCLFIIAMTLTGMPYAIMIGTLIAFTALIPVMGAFIGCGIGAFMILIDNPIKALWFVVMFLLIQQLEGNLIYPKVVGNSVGLPSIWVLASVSIGGSLFGVVGMLIFIPLMSTGYSLLRDDVKRRNDRKAVSQEQEAENVNVSESVEASKDEGDSEDRKESESE